jgi:MYXO-CTERM domain-containing protein
VQLVLFSGVGSVYFAFDDWLADADSGIYYTQANRYLTSFDGMNEDTLLVYDSQSKVVYLHMPAIPEPATGTLGLLALISLAARRRRAK